MRNILYKITLTFQLFVLLESCDFLNDPCAMSDGPCHGIKISLSLDTVTIDKFMQIDDGWLAIANMNKREEDIDPPLLIRLDKVKTVVWAISLDTRNSNCEIPLYSMSGIKLIEEAGRHKIVFFNDTHREPGVIYLDNNFDFRYMCLSPF